MILPRDNAHPAEPLCRHICHPIVVKNRRVQSIRFYKKIKNKKLL